jgi:hypothetical protein
MALWPFIRKLVTIRSHFKRGEIFNFPPFCFYVSCRPLSFSLPLSSWSASKDLRVGRPFLSPAQNSLLMTDNSFFPIPGLTRNPAGDVASFPCSRPRHCGKRSDEAIWLALSHLHTNLNPTNPSLFFLPCRITNLNIPTTLLKHPSDPKTRFEF